MLRALMWLLLANCALAAEPLQVRMEGARFVGSVGCKSSSCHGGAGEKRSQFITWSQKDFHTRAYAILTNARSERMAQALGISAAHESSRCTSCHAPMLAVEQTRLTKGADPREGVSCEACHGAAEPWLRGHTRPDWSYATRVGAGMRDLKSFYVRANTCVACHQNLEGDIAAAGHPELVFELDSQLLAQPKHWRDPVGSGTRAWLVGQAVALRELSWRLGLTGEAETSTFAQWHALAWLLAEVTSGQGTLTRVDPPGRERSPATYAHTQQQADTLARRAAAQSFGRDFARRLLHRLASVEATFSQASEDTGFALSRRALRLVLALERLWAAATDDSPAPPELEALREELRSPSPFNAARFGDQLARFRRSVGELE